MKLISTVLLSTLVLLTVLPSDKASAHMMPAQRGTLKLVDDGVFMVLSLPVSAFEGVDQNHDGMMSSLEFVQHRPDIIKAVQDNVLLKDQNGPVELQGLLISHISSEHVNSQNVSNLPDAQIIVTGRYALTDLNSPLQFNIGLYGKSTAEQSLEVTATRKSDGYKQRMLLTAQSPESNLFD